MCYGFGAGFCEYEMVLLQGSEILSLSLASLSLLTILFILRFVKKNRPHSQTPGVSRIQGNLGSPVRDKGHSCPCCFLSARAT